MSKILAYRAMTVASETDSIELTCWQQFLVKCLGVYCVRFKWYRRYVGGRWAKLGYWTLVAQCPAKRYDREHMDLYPYPYPTGDRLSLTLFFDQWRDLTDHYSKCTCEVYPERKTTTSCHPLAPL
jgi:hypothetical protein